jgi:hypothetical protein
MAPALHQQGNDLVIPIRVINNANRSTKKNNGGETVIIISECSDRMSLGRKLTM